MLLRSHQLRFALFAALVSTTLQAQTATPVPAAGLLNRTEAAAVLPDKVFFHGQSATVQARNSAGIRFGDGRLALFTLVDTSGYSSAIQQTYQAYLLTETPLRIGDQVLPVGAYGFGFVANDRIVVMDLGGNELFRAATTHDTVMLRPTPLQLVLEPSAATHYRLYLGRSYVTLAAAPR